MATFQVDFRVVRSVQAASQPANQQPTNQPANRSTSPPIMGSRTTKMFLFIPFLSLSLFLTFSLFSLQSFFSLLFFRYNIIFVLLFNSSIYLSSYLIMNMMARVDICNLYFFINHAFISIILVSIFYLLTIEKSTKKRTITTTKNVYTLRSITFFLCFTIYMHICIYTSHYRYCFERSQSDRDEIGKLLLIVNFTKPLCVFVI